MLNIKMAIGVAMGLSVSMPMIAMAHGPSPQKVEKEFNVKVAPDKAWAIVKDFGGLAKLNPGLVAPKVEQKDGSIVITAGLKPSGKITERVKGADDADKKLKFEIVDGNVPLTDFNGNIIVKPGPSAGESTIYMMARFYRMYKLNPPIPEGQDDESAIKAAAKLLDDEAAAINKAVGGK